MKTTDRRLADLLLRAVADAGFDSATLRFRSDGPGFEFKAEDSETGHSFVVEAENVRSAVDAVCAIGKGGL